MPFATCGAPCCCTSVHIINVLGTPEPVRHKLVRFLQKPSLGSLQSGSLCSPAAVTQPLLHRNGQGPWGQVLGQRGPLAPLAKFGQRDANIDDKAIAVLDLVEELALEAGELIRRKCGLATQVERKGVRTDLVTEVDREVEALIQRKVQGAFPLHRILGEESATEAELARLDKPAGEDEWTWIVDPIDGTLNFVGGMPLCVVSIGVARGGMLEVGAVYDPFRDELFSGRYGDGASLNGRPLAALPQDADLADAAVSVGFPSKAEPRAAMVGALARVAPRVRTVRALGSAALHMSYVAAGRLGAFFEYDLKPWDVAAARVVLQEAGGKVTDMKGNKLPLSAGAVLATNGSPSIHGGLVQLINAS